MYKLKIRGDRGRIEGENRENWEKRPKSPNLKNAKIPKFAPGGFFFKKINTHYLVQN